MIRIERSRAIFSAHFTNSKMQHGIKFLFMLSDSKSWIFQWWCAILAKLSLLGTVKIGET